MANFAAPLMQITFLNHPSVPTERVRHTRQAVEQLVSNWKSGEDVFRLQTSGSTGAPKVVTFSRSQLIASARLTARTFGLRKGDKVLLALGPEYVAGYMMVVRALVLDLELFVLPPVSNPLQLLPTELELAFAAFVPLQLREGPLEALNCICTTIIGGAPLDPKLEGQVSHSRNRIYHTYGMTETLTHVAICQLAPQPQPEYEPLEGVETGVDERGCLWVETPVVPGQRVQTNDLVELIQEGSFRWLGRWDHIINSGGVKVSPEEVEREAAFCLQRAGEPVAAFVAGLPDERLGERVVLVVEHRPDRAFSMQLLACLKQHLPHYKVPKEVLFAQPFERTPSGKVKRKETLQRAAATT